MKYSTAMSIFSLLEPSTQTLEQYYVYAENKHRPKIKKKKKKIPKRIKYFTKLAGENNNARKRTNQTLNNRYIAPLDIDIGVYTE